MQGNRNNKVHIAGNVSILHRRPTGRQCTELSAWLLLLPMIPATSQPVYAQQAGSASAAAPAETLHSLSFFEVLHGSGLETGYVLSQANIIAKSLIIRVGGRTLTVIQDYTFDPVSGALTFTNAVDSAQSIRVSYRYKDSLLLQKQLLGVPSLQLGYGSATHLNLLFDLPSDQKNSSTISSPVGLGLSTAFGEKRAGNYSGVMYFENPFGGKNNRTDSGKFDPNAPKPSTAKQFITQNLNVQSGSLDVYANYQDIGKGFNGFQALRAGGNANKTLLDQLEAEKGLKRLGFGLGMNLNPNSKNASGFGFDWNQVQDGTGTISQQSAEFANKDFHLNYSSRDVSKNFQAFSGLRETDKSQWAHEKGLHTSNLGFGFNLGGGTKTQAPGALDLQNQSFGDATGSLNREVINLHTGSLGVNFMNRSSQKAFGRLGDISDNDKANLALDLYKQYDVKANLAQVTAADKAQVARESGLTRDGLTLSDGLGKTGSVSFSQLSIKDSSVLDLTGRNSVNRESISLDQKHFALQFVSRKTGLNFGRIGDLADIEKNNLALEIRRQFDPNALMAQVTQPERDQAVREAGITRNSLLGKFDIAKGSSLTFSKTGITSELTGTSTPSTSGALERQQIAYSSKTLQVTILDQSIADNFTQLTSLSDLEKTHFANEHGLHRKQFGLNWQINKLTKFSFSNLSLTDTPDAYRNAMSAAVASGLSPYQASTSILSQMRKQNFTFDTKGVSIAGNFADISKDFARSADLAAADPEKKQIETERGFKRSDLTAKLSLFKGLTLDAYNYSAADAIDALGHDTWKNSLLYSPNKKWKLSYLDDGDISTAAGLKNGGQHSVLSLNENLGKGSLLNLYQDQTAVYSNNVQTLGTQTDFLHFETAQAKPNAMSYEAHTLQYTDGRYENSSNLNIHTKPSKLFGFSFQRIDVMRDELNPSQVTDKLDFSWQANKKFAIVGGVSQMDSTDDKNVNTVSVGLQGEPIKNFTMTAKFDEVHQLSQNTKDQADISFSNAKPISFGPMRDLTITARYASLNDLKKLQNETMTGNIAWKMFKNDCLLNYAGNTKPDGTSTIDRLYSFISDKNPKLWFHTAFFYKSRTMLDNREHLVRRFTADAQLTKKTHFIYMYGTLPEDEHGNIIPQETGDISLKHMLSNSQNISLFYRLNNNQLTKILTRSLGFAYESKFSKSGKFDVGYSREANGFATSYFTSNRLHFALDKQINTEQLLSVSADVMMPDSSGHAQEIQGHFDLSRKF